MDHIKEFQKKHSLNPDGIVGRDTLIKMKEVFNIPTNESMAHFMGQLDHETGNFQYEIENLNYSWQRLRQVFPKYFPTNDLAKQYEKRPQRIANRVYANRMGNGNEASGDGWRYRGRGSIQLTGKNNYTKFSKYMGNNDILTNPDKILPDHYWNVALFYFEENKLFDIIEDVAHITVMAVTKKINGGYNGLKDRQDKTLKYYNLLKESDVQDKKQPTVNPVPDNGGGNIVPVVPEGQGTEKGSGGGTEGEKGNNFKRFLAACRFWILHKTGW